MEPRIDPFVYVDHATALIQASSEATAGEVIAFQPISGDRRPPCQKGPGTGETWVWRAREPVALGRALGLSSSRDPPGVEPGLPWVTRSPVTSLATGPDDAPRCTLNSRYERCFSSGPASRQAHADLPAPSR